MIEGTKALREKFGGSYNDYREAAIRIKEIQLKWTDKQEVIFGQKMSMKQVNNLKIEGRLMKQLAELKKFCGPFTDAKEVDTFLEDPDISEADKLKRMKMEVMYSRDTSLSVPKNSDVFRIRTRSQLTAIVFGNNIKSLSNIF